MHVYVCVWLIMYILKKSYASNQRLACEILLRAMNFHLKQSKNYVTINISVICRPIFYTFDTTNKFSDFTFICSSYLAETKDNNLVHSFLLQHAGICHSRRICSVPITEHEYFRLWKDPAPNNVKSSR